MKEGVKNFSRFQQYAWLWNGSEDKKLSYRLETGRQQRISFVAKLISIAHSCL